MTTNDIPAVDREAHLPRGLLSRQGETSQGVSGDVGGTFPRSLSSAGQGLKKLEAFNALVDRLCLVPDVGCKIANLTMVVGFDLPAICVDVHVYRITNRLGLGSMKTPFEMEMTLRKILPMKYWKTWNSHLVLFGQMRYNPLYPKCTGCPITHRYPS